MEEKTIGKTLEEQINFWRKKYTELKEQKEEWFEVYNDRVSDIIKLKQRIEELEEINEEHRKLNGELREEINKLKKEKEDILDYMEE